MKPVAPVTKYAIGLPTPRPWVYQPPRQSTMRARALAASMRACLRFSSRHWISEKMMMIGREEDDHDEHHVGDRRIGCLAVPALAAATVARAAGQHEQRSCRCCTDEDDQSCSAASRQKAYLTVAAGRRRTHPGVADRRRPHGSIAVSSGGL